MEYKNEMTLRFNSLSVNEGFARAAVAGFCVQLNPTLDEITDIKTAVSEAVTNCVVHAYPKSLGQIEIWVGVSDQTVVVKVRDWGVGIKDIKRAREPFFTTKPSEERAGMGFTVMESFMDNVVVSSKDSGVEIVMTKRLEGKKAMLNRG